MYAFLSQNLTTFIMTYFPEEWEMIRTMWLNAIGTKQVDYKDQYNFIIEVLIAEFPEILEAYKR